MLYLGDMPFFLNLVPELLDLKTYLNFIKKIKILHPLFLSVNIEHKEVLMFFRGKTYLNFIKKIRILYPLFLSVNIEHKEVLMFCIPQEPHRKLLVKESHEGGIMGHFGVDKTLELVKGKFFWPHMTKEVQRHCHRCISCLKAKFKTMPHGLYTPLPFASAPWKDMSMDFIL